VNVGDIFKYNVQVAEIFRINTIFQIVLSAVTTPRPKSIFQSISSSACDGHLSDLEPVSQNASNEIISVGGHESLDGTAD